MKQGQQEILKSLQETIEKTRKALAGMDRGADLSKYRDAHKRLKRAQRSLNKLKKVAAKLQEKKESELKKTAKKEEPAKTEPAPVETAKPEPAKKEKASEEKPAPESAPTT